MNDFFRLLNPFFCFRDRLEFFCQFNQKKGDSSGSLSRNGGPDEGICLTLRHFEEERDARYYISVYDGSTPGFAPQCTLEAVLRYILFKIGVFF